MAAYMFSIFGIPIIQDQELIASFLSPLLFTVRKFKTFITCSINTGAVKLPVRQRSGTDPPDHRQGQAAD